MCALRLTRGLIASRSGWMPLPLTQPSSPMPAPGNPVSFDALQAMDPRTLELMRAMLMRNITKPAGWSLEVMPSVAPVVRPPGLGERLDSWTR